MFFILTLLVIFFQLSTKYPNVTFIEQIFIFVSCFGLLMFFEFGKKENH